MELLLEWFALEILGGSGRELFDGLVITMERVETPRHLMPPVQIHIPLSLNTQRHRRMNRSLNARRN
jgi:hypothetical protein